MHLKIELLHTETGKSSRLKISVKLRMPSGELEIVEYSKRRTPFTRSDVTKIALNEQIKFQQNTANVWSRRFEYSTLQFE